MPQALKYKEGYTIDYTPGSAVSAGDVVVQGGLVGVATTDIEANKQGSLAIDGLYDFTKQASASVTFSVGDSAYWDDTNNRAVMDDANGANAYIGTVTKAAVDADTSVRAKLGSPLGAIWNSLHSGQLVTVTGSTVTLSAKTHGHKTTVLTRAAGIAVTLPAATGSGTRFDLVLGAAVTSNSTTIKVNATPGTDTMTGNAVVLQDAADTMVGFEAGATADTITWNGSTTGGLLGDHAVLTDIASGLWQVRIVQAGTSTEATPFSATV